MRTIFDLKNLKENSTIGIYGAGEGGKRLYQLLSNHRKDINVKFFIDDFKTGNIDNIPIISLKEIENKSFDFIIIATINEGIMIKNFKKIGIHNYLVAGRNLITIFETHQFFNNEELTLIKKKSSFINKLLFSDKDKILFELLINNRIWDEYNYFQNIAEYFIENSYNKKMYCDYIRNNLIKKVIDGGIHNGDEIMSFLGNFDNLEKIYAFEPDIDGIDSQFYHKSIINPKIEISNKALWEKNTKLKLTIIPGRSYIQYENQINAINVKEVEGISIDNFVKEKKIKIDFIKLDVEGSEPEVLRGAYHSIKNFRPQMAISIYHSKFQMFEIIEYIQKNFKNYIFRIEHYSPTITETILYAIPAEII